MSPSKLTSSSTALLLGLLPLGFLLDWLGFLLGDFLLLGLRLLMFLLLGFFLLLLNKSLTSPSGFLLDLDGVAAGDLNPLFLPLPFLFLFFFLASVDGILATRIIALKNAKFASFMMMYV